MKTKKQNNLKINILSLGCHKNLVDSEDLLTQLKGNNLSASIESLDNSDIVIINTCGFIQDAKEQSISTILNCIEAKKEGLIKKVMVIGCLSERYKGKLREELTEVDHFFGTNQIPDILKTLEVDYKKELIGERQITTPSHYAYLKISEGCNRKCAFCAIPLMRGKHVSKPIEHILLEAQNLVKQGVKEIMLIAQDLTFYGIDLYQKNRLAELLNRLADIEGLYWIRLHYTFPTGFPLEIAKVIRDRTNICNYLDIPLQHASDRILKKMKRGITNQKTVDLINYIRDTVPNIAIRTTFITGFPDESEKDVDILLNFVEKMRFERVGVFTYSHEENTSAHKYQDTIDQEIKEARAEQLMELQRIIALENNIKSIGKTYRVLFDKFQDNFLVGRTEYDSPEVDNQVFVPYNQNIEIGHFGFVKIKDAHEFDIYGEIVNNESSRL